MADVTGRAMSSGAVLQPPVGQGKATGPLGNMSVEARAADNRRKAIDRLRGELSRWDAIADTLDAHGFEDTAVGVDERCAPLAKELDALVRAELGIDALEE